MVFGMNEQVKNIYEQARKLAPEEQLELVQILQAHADLDIGIEQAWLDEIEDRIAALDRGEARVVPAEQVLAKLGRS